MTLTECRNGTLTSAFSQTPGALTITLITVAVLAILVYMDRIYSGQLKELGENWPVVISLAINCTKTILPLALLFFVLHMSPVSLGWVRGNTWQAVWKSFIVTLVMIAVIFIYRKYSHLVFGQPYVTSGERAVTGPISAATFALGGFAALLNAFGEEIVFRGMLLPLLARKTNVVWALAVQAIVFSGYHFFPFQNSVMLFIMGIIFGAGYLWSRSLLTPVLAHLLMNAAAVVGMAVTYINSV